MTWIAAGMASGAATMAVVQSVKGKQDQKKAERDRPQYEIPEEMYQNLNQAQQQSLQGMPAEQQQQYLNNLQQSSAYALQQTASRKGGLAGVAAIDQQQKNSLNQMNTQDSLMAIQNKQQLMGVRNQMADYKGQEYQVNKLNPYYENLAQKQARNAALFQNLNNAGGIMAGGMGSGGATKSAPAQPSNVQYVDMNKINQQQGSLNNMQDYDPQYNPNGIIPDGISWDSNGTYNV